MSIGRLSSFEVSPIVFVQGSGWSTPDLNYELPMLSRFAEEGIAVAAVCHRSALDGHAFPACRSFMTN